MTRHNPVLRSYLKPISIITLIFLGLTLTARAFGTTQPPNPALRGFTEGCEGKPQPCWYGVVPGVTTMNEAIAALNQRDNISRQDNYSFHQSDNPECFFSLWGRDTISYVDIRNCIGIELGDIVNSFGDPNYIVTGTLLFRKSGIMVTEERDPKICFKLKPHSKVEFITVINSQFENGLPIWYGFKPYWWYAERGGNTPCAVIHSPGY